MEEDDADCPSPEVAPAAAPQAPAAPDLNLNQEDDEEDQALVTGGAAGGQLHGFHGGGLVGQESAHQAQARAEDEAERAAREKEEKEEEEKEKEEKEKEEKEKAAREKENKLSPLEALSLAALGGDIKGGVTGGAPSAADAGAAGPKLTPAPRQGSSATTAALTGGAPSFDNASVDLESAAGGGFGAWGGVLETWAPANKARHTFDTKSEPLLRPASQTPRSAGNALSPVARPSHAGQRPQAGGHPARTVQYPTTGRSDLTACLPGAVPGTPDSMTGTATDGTESWMETPEDNGTCSTRPGKGGLPPKKVKVTVDEIAAEDALLGTAEDKVALKEAIRRFMRDDLTDPEDVVVAALRMQIHATTRFQRIAGTLLTCGIAYFFMPLEDYGVLILTRKGRIISYGKSQEAEVDATRVYLGKVMRSIVFLTVFVGVIWACFKHVPGLRAALVVDLKMACITGSILLTIIVAYIYAQRPRRDCGSTFRQHFEVSSLVAATYVRMDHGRSIWDCWVHRRAGHMRLCFGKKYPDAATYEAELPVGSPNVGGVTPVMQIPPAVAGEPVAAQRDQAAQNMANIQSGLGAFAKVLGVFAVLGVLATVYDYTAALHEVVHSTQICNRKVKGCSWSVPNQAYLGKKLQVSGANPPNHYDKGGCDDSGRYCDVFYRPTDYCATGNGGEPNSVNFLLPCFSLKKLRTALSSHIGTARDGQTAKRYVLAYTNVFRDARAQQQVIVERDMWLESIGPPTSPENQALRTPAGLNFELLQERCESVYGGFVNVTFEWHEEYDDLFEEDCEELQNSCLAEAFGPETSGYWPLSRWLDSDYKRSLCLYGSLPVSVTRPFQGRIWRVLEGGSEGPGLSCHGKPLGQFNFSGPGDHLTSCKVACEKTTGCDHVFYGWPNDVHGISAKDGVEYSCTLFAKCPAQANAHHENNAFVPVPCNKRCGMIGSQSCMPYARGYVHNEGLGLAGCREACLNLESRLATCNSFAYDLQSKTCTVHGPSNLPHPGHSWTDAAEDTGGSPGICFVRSPPSQDNRKMASTPGVLLKFSNNYRCSGCWVRSMYDFAVVPSNFVGLLTNIVTIMGFLYVSNKARESLAVAKVKFSGKPIIDLRHVENAANFEGFEDRERGLNTFLKRCFEMMDKPLNPAQKELPPAVDCWEQDPDSRSDLGFVHDVVPVTGTSFDEYEVSDIMRTQCFVNKDLLGILPSEKVTAAWSETRRMGCVKPVLFLMLWAFVVWLLEEGMVKAFGSQLYAGVALIVLALGMWYFYLERRRKLQGLCVLTNTGRLIQFSRLPGHLFFKCCGGASIRLDVFAVGNISLAQVDTPARPLLQDRFEAGLSTPWRRGVVTIRCAHGLLQITRNSGEALPVFRAFNTLLGSKKTQGLQAVGAGGAEICDFVPSQDLVHIDETHVWERRLDAYGYIGDAFNYASILTITDRRVYVSHARVPKPLSLRGMILGPLTWGDNCNFIQEYYGHNSYLSIAVIGHDDLESYATMRVRSPPWWPGFGSPVATLGVGFLGRYMTTYPAALTVAQRPYGLDRRVFLKTAIRLGPSEDEGRLKILESTQLGAPRGHNVVTLWDMWGMRMDLHDPKWQDPEGAELPAGSWLALEPGDPEWDTYAEEPWLTQLRQILDHILGRVQAPEETWLETDPPLPLGARTCRQRCWGWIFGGEMLGEHTRAGQKEGEDYEEGSGQSRLPPGSRILPRQMEWAPL